MDKSTQIDTLLRLARVSRETITSLKKYEEYLILANKNLNLIGKSTVDQIWIRHFLDSIQVIDFIDKSDKTLVDIGSGAGFPGLVLALASKDRKIPLKIKLFDKSPKKTKFLKEIVKELNLNVEVINKNVFDQQIIFTDDVFAIRAGKASITIMNQIFGDEIETLNLFGLRDALQSAIKT